MEQKTEQPISIIINHAKQEIVNTLNQLEITPTIMKYVVKEIYDMLCEAADVEYRNDLIAAGERAIAESGENPIELTQEPSPTDNDWK